MLISLLLTSALADTPTQRKAVERCMQNWADHPFGDTPDFRVLSTSVRVMGIGSSEVREEPTDSPDLVLVEPSVNVLTRTTYKLHNPNGWYCFHANVGVLSKIVFDADCGANLADSRSGAVVMGDSDVSGGVVVLGDVEVRRSCPKTPAPTSTPAPTDAAPSSPAPAPAPAPAASEATHPAPAPASELERAE